MAVAPESSADKSPTEKTSCNWLVATCKYVPYLNSIYDLLVDNTPDEDAVKDLLNLIGLIDALMLGVIFSVVTGVDFESTTEADERFMNPNPDPKKNGYHELYESNDFFRVSEEFGSPSSRFMLDVTVGIAFLFDSLIIILLTYMDLVNKNFDANSPSKRNKLLTSWWYSGRFLVIGALVTTYYGVVNAISSAIPLIILNIPDYWVEKHGEISQAMNSPYGHSQYMIDTGWIALHFAMIFMGIGTGMRYYEEDKQQKDSELARQSRIMKESQGRWEIILKGKDVDMYFSDVADEYIAIFEDNWVDFNDRGLLTDQNLKDLGIECVGHRVKLLSLFASSSNEDDDELKKSPRSRNSMQVIDVKPNPATDRTGESKKDEDEE